ncbi:MAG: 1-phosphofructokinase family hexose kinase [Actinomycetota bacterium]|nr:1-phosphofructokinase family hexose kinase [Actinomycetota bacterium]
MIVTLTANPSLDRTLALGDPLVPGGVHRAVGCTDEPGGKGVNVARAVGAAGRPVVAVLPARAEDPLLAEMRHLELAHHAVHVDDLVRVNLTVTDPAGVTTKINLPGSPLSVQARDQLAAVLLKEAAGARWTVLSGSLPPGVAAGWYAALTHALHEHDCRVAVDTSGAPLRAVVSDGARSRPDLLKPNAEELAEALGLDHGRDSAEPEQAARHARTLVGAGTGAVLVTLGADGAVLATADGAWHAAPPPTVPRSTVGAGDCALAGYLLADLDGADAPQRLRLAVAYGSAAAGLPGSAVPEPHQVRPDAVTVTNLTP